MMVELPLPAVRISAPWLYSRQAGLRRARSGVSCPCLLAVVEMLANGCEPATEAGAHQNEEKRDVEDCEDGRRHHAADHRGTDGDPAVRARARGNREREYAEDEGEAGHDDRAKPKPGGFDR